MSLAGSLIDTRLLSPCVLHHRRRGAQSVLNSTDKMDPAVQPKPGSKQYLRCTPRSHMFQQNSESHRHNVLLHALSKWAKGEAAPTNLAKGRGICVNSHFDSGNIEVRLFPGNTYATRGLQARRSDHTMACAGLGYHPGSG